MAQAVVPSRINVEVLRGNPARLRRERVMRGLFFSAAFLSVVISVGIVVSLAGGTLDFLRKVPLSTLWSDGWFPRNNLFDIKTIVVGHAARRGDRHARRRAARARERRSTCPSTPRPGHAASAEAHPGDRSRASPASSSGSSRSTVISPDLVQKLFGSDVPLFNLAAAGIGVGSSSSRSSRRSPRTRCTRCPSALREASFGLGAAARGDEHADGGPGRRLRDRRRDDPRRSLARSARR